MRANARGCLFVCYAVAARRMLYFARNHDVCWRRKQLEQSRWTILCPCCDATLVIDRETGAIISHAEKTKPVASFDEMAKTMERQREQRDRIFDQEIGSLKSRERILEEKFRDAMKRAGDDKDKPFRNPLDIE